MSTSSLERKQTTKTAPKNIIIPSTSSTKPHKSLFELEAARNQQKQKKIDNDVLILGYSTKPPDNQWLELVKQAGINEKMVASHSSLSTSNGSYTTTISFKYKVNQEQLIKSVNSKKDGKIFAKKSLTKFNATVKGELKELLAIGAIKAYRLHNYLFEVKESSWTAIGTRQALKKFIEQFKNAKKGKDDQERMTNEHDQTKINGQLVMSGFPAWQQDVDEIVRNFAHLINIPIGDVSSCKKHRVDSVCKVIVVLSSKSAMRKALKAKGLKLRQLTGTFGGGSVSPMITFSRHLTQFNEDVKAQLSYALRMNKIDKFEFDCTFFKVKTDESAKWAYISCRNDLREVLGRA